MVSGAQSMMSSVLRIMTSGILAGAIATMIICAVGVFIDISVITVAPIAIAIGQKAGLTKSSILLAMIGGDKAGSGSVNMSISDRMKLIPYEAMVGLTSTVVAIVLYLI